MGEGADADAEVRIPRLALGSIQRGLACVHAAVGLHATLQAIAEGVTSSRPYTNVTVTTARQPDAVDLHVEAVVGPPKAVPSVSPKCDQNRSAPHASPPARVLHQRRTRACRVEQHRHCHVRPRL